ncbi:hypothetical protein GCM10025869_23020 [Homoserinibacter gongjuensis]|uniref:Alcohol dehydrogenase-like N-terminal domain-containing protein n=1 Tax=Homoserinibacter gongjuensis TaxID=1162968 RepID=A0ABQ6JWL0_9MICO|nr:hypothetical protein GCM10025869_23020 [Homoserinibacter gongjuensis]
MRATLIHAPGDVRLEEVPDPRLSTGGDAIVRVVAACVCGSDLWPYRGVTPTHEPHRIGHEFVGIVEEVGPDVARIRVGDFVIAPFYDCDMTCVNCVNGFSTSCLNGGWWGSDDRMGAFADGGQGELVRVPHADGSLVATPSMPDDALVPHLLTLSDVMGTGHHAAVSAGVGPGDTVVVVGDGAVGLCAVLASARLGAERIVAMSRHADRQALALRFGATDIVAERGDEGGPHPRALRRHRGGCCARVRGNQGVDGSGAALRAARRSGGFRGRAERCPRVAHPAHVQLERRRARGSGARAQLRRGAAARGVGRAPAARGRVRPRAAAHRGGRGVRRDGRAAGDQGAAAP